MSATMGVSVLATSRQVSTQNRLNTLEQALLQFRTANGRLPCPGDLTLAPGSANYGIEGATPGTCTGGTPTANFSAAGGTNTFATGAEGSLPAVTLGLPPDFMVDGWGNKIRYVVDTSMTANAAFVSTPAGCINGAITVKDNNGNARSANAIYALISSGADGHGAYTKNGAITNAGSIDTNEWINCHCNASASPTTYAPTYVQWPTPTTNTFDDIVTYKERWQMQIPWETMGKCNYIYVGDGNNYRVQVFTMSGGFLFGIGAGYQGVAGSIGSNSNANGGLDGGSDGIVVDSSGNIWATDVWHPRVEKFNSSGSYLSQFGSGGAANGQFNNPVMGMAIDSNNNLWVVDNGNNRVEEFNSSGSYLAAIGAGYQGVGGSVGSAGSANGQFSSPRGVAIDSSGNIWVADSGNFRVQKFSSTGTWLQSIGGPSPYTCETSPSGSVPACASGLGSGQFSTPNYIAFDASGNIFVTDNGGPAALRVQKFNSSGIFLSQFPCPSGGCSWGIANNKFEDPKGIAIDSSGNIWVADDSANRVSEFNSSGSFIMAIGAGYNGVAGAIGSTGTASGQFNGPQGLLIHSR
jgi:sugar lactone lactonase YvrE/type II secretory pathway pseudopilin PulG